MLSVVYDYGQIESKRINPALQTQGKIERYLRNMKNIVKLENYYYPEELKGVIDKFVNYYNHKRYRKSFDNVTPADVCYGINSIKFPGIIK